MKESESQSEDISVNSEQTSNDEEQEKEIWTCQYTTGSFLCTGLIIAYCLRVNLSVAIVAMVGKSATNSANMTEDEQPACPYRNNSTEGESIDGDVGWTETDQGLVLGAFYWGYTCTNILGGILSEKFGSKIIFGGAIAIASVLTLLSPLTVTDNSGFFIAIRTLEGFVLGVTFPSMFNMLSGWCLPEQRSKYSGLVISGVELGTIIGLSASGFLCESDFLGGWPSAFYLFGGLGVIWSILWFIFVFDSPTSHPRISKREFNKLKNITKVKPQGFKMLPWMDVAKSIAFWSILVEQFAYNWVMYTILSEIPSYLYQIQHFQLSSNGVLSSLPYAVNWFTAVTYTQLMTRVHLSGKMELLSIRRLSMFIAGYMPVLSLIVMCFVGCNETIAVVILCVTVGVGGVSYAGFVCTPLDIAPRYSGTLYGIINTFGTIPGFVSPILTGIITQDNQSLEAWRTVFLISASLLLVGNTFHLFTISVDIQPWNFHGIEDENTSQKKRNSKVSIES